MLKIWRKQFFSWHQSFSNEKRKFIPAQKSISFIQGVLINQMTVKAKIKVIKKDAIKTVVVPASVERKVKQAAAREMVSTVSDWVSDFQQRRREETRNALEMLFQNSPQTSRV